MTRKTYDQLRSARWFAPDGPAAVWERQALLKARPVIGAAEAREV